ncbi:MAG: alpha/beta hydrolase [Firmicutes bacterium]|nr:alpha/beta hydrolase [Bacillota bacterium]
MSTENITVNSSKVGRSISIQKNIIHYVEHEGGRPVILLHGLGFSLYSMRHIYSALAEMGYHVITVDLPGCGYSMLSGDSLGSPKHMAELLHLFLKALKLEGAHFYGIAEGAIYALRLSQLYPKDVLSLTLTSPGSLTRHYPYAYRMLPSTIMGEMLVRSIKRKHIEKMLRWIFFNETVVTNAMVRQTYMPFERPECRLGLLYLLRDYNDNPVYNQLRYVACPVNLLWGEWDSAHPISMSDYFIKHIPNIQFRMFQNCGHLLHEERPHWVSKEIDGFIQQVVRPPEDGGENVEEEEQE